VAAILNDLPSAAYISRTAGDGNTFEVVPGPPIEGGPYGMGFAKTNAGLRDAVNEALGTLIADGTYLQILQSWGVEQGALKESAINGA
jgi:polar amino acid transport system substrate-binding protein